MFEKLTRSRNRLAIDLDTIRDTLRYMESDMRHADGMESIAKALRSTLDEIEIVQNHKLDATAQDDPADSETGTASIPAATFVPLRPRRRTEDGEPLPTN